MSLESNAVSMVSDLFFPSAPITNRKFFYGRFNQIKKIENAINERGQHIVIYGERGIGKTSLANTIEDPSAYVLKMTCNRRNTYDSIWRELLKKFALLIKFEPLAGDDKNRMSFIDTILAEPLIETETITYLMGKFENRIIIILDEFDVIQDQQTLYYFADNIKSFSDNCPNITFVFVGIAQNVNELLGEHPSLERCISQVHIPRMTPQELSDVIDSALLKLKIKMDPEVKQNIITFSQGFPHYVHLLGKYACLSALKRQYNLVVKTNLDEAIDIAIDNLYESIRNVYQKATFSNKVKSLYENVLWASAVVSVDEHETFRASDLIAPLEKFTGKTFKINAFAYHLGKLATEMRGNILESIKISSITRYKFKNPLIKAYILLLLYKRGLFRKKETVR